MKTNNQNTFVSRKKKSFVKMSPGESYIEALKPKMKSILPDYDPVFFEIKYLIDVISFCDARTKNAREKKKLVNINQKLNGYFLKLQKEKKNLLKKIQIYNEMNIFIQDSIKEVKSFISNKKRTEGKGHE